MEINFAYSFAAIIIVGLVTIFTRALPYLLFGGNKEIPSTIKYLSTVLPASIMTILVLYCLRNINLTSFPFGLAEFISVIAVIIIQVIKKNTILSILLGTILYMVLTRTIFPI